MKKYQTGLNTTRYYFTLSEHEKYLTTLEKYKGYTTLLFVNNGYAVEITKRTIKA